MKKIDGPLFFAVAATSLVVVAILRPWTKELLDVLVGFGTLALAAFALLQWRETRQTAQRQLRAYLSFIPQSFRLDRIGLRDECTIDHLVENSGQTPAYRMKVDADIRPMPYSLPADFIVKTPPLSPIIDEGGVGAGRNTSGRIRKDVDLNRPGLALGGAERIYLVGVVRYFDVFGSEHATHFCGAVINLPAMLAAARAGQQIPRADFEWTAQHNHST